MGARVVPTIATVILFFGASTVAADAQDARSDAEKSILPGVSVGLLAARSRFHDPYDGAYRTSLAPMFALRAFERIGSRFALGLGLQYVDQRVMGLGPILQYQLEYLEAPVTVTGVLGRMAGVQAEIHGGAVAGLPMRCRVNSTVPGGQKALISCGDAPVAVSRHRMEVNLRGGAALRTRVGPMSLGLSGAVQYGVHDVFGNARVTTLLFGLELGR